MSRFQEYVRRYRFLLCIYVPALIIAAWELTDGIYEDGKAPDPESQAASIDYTLQYSRLYRELYPDRPRANYFRGLDELFFKRDPQAVREYFEKALDTGIKTDEDLLYYYAYTLVLLKEDPQTIDAAVQNWRRNFPRSHFADPRTAGQGQTSQQKPAPRPAIRPYPNR